MSPVPLRASETPENVPAASARTVWPPIEVALAVLLRTTALVVLREAQTPCRAGPADLDLGRLTGWCRPADAPGSNA